MDTSYLFCPDAQRAPDGRITRCDGLWPVFVPHSSLSEAAIQDGSPSRLVFAVRQNTIWRAPSAGLLAREDRTDFIKLRLMNIINGNEEVDRAISNGKLHALLHFHTRPINVVVFHGSDREHLFSGWFPA